MIGCTYYEGGQPVIVLIRWNGPRKDLRPTLPLVTTQANGPRNVLVERADGSKVVRPFRGLTKSRHRSAG